MASFTGMTVRINLKEPPNFGLQGKVKEIIVGHTITLQNVLLTHDGSRRQIYVVRAAQILDLNVVDTSATPTPTSAVRTTLPTLPPPNVARVAQHAAKAQPPAGTVAASTTSSRPEQQPSNFVDPAILSYGRSPAPPTTATHANNTAPATPIKSMLAKAAENLPTNASSLVGEAAKSSGSHKVPGLKETVQRTPDAVRSEALVAQDGQADGAQGVAQVEGATRKKVRRGQKKKGTSTPHDAPPVLNVEVSRNGNDMSTDGNGKRGKGWRQTPLLQPSPGTASTQGRGSTKKSRRRQQEAAEGQQSGWATEYATDIQDAGDFDFEANHKLFDKKQVFDQLRQGDTTADEDRLVSHNKVHRPGTYGGKNLHPTENVLSPQLGPKHNSNELDSTSDADTELNFANGRSSSKHSASRTALKKPPTRQNSAHVESKPHPLSASMSSDRGKSFNRSVTSLSRQARPVPVIATGSPRVDLSHSPGSAVSTSKTPAASMVSSSHALVEHHLAVLPTMTACPVLLPPGLETLESETVARYGLTREAITESAARCVAEMAVQMLDHDAGGRRPSRTNTTRASMSSSLTLDRTTDSTVVILAGLHDTGARAIAAARHLVSRRYKIILAEAAPECTTTQSPEAKAQISILKRLAKGGADIHRGPWRRASSYIKNLARPPALIIDALLAGAPYDVLLTSSSHAAAAAQQEAREMIDWANRSRAPVLSLACPSGVSGFDGGATTVEGGEPLAVRPDRVLCLGAPVQGVLEAMRAGERWEVCLADIGVDVALRREEAVGFGRSWVVELRFVEKDEEGLGAGGEVL